MRSAEKERVPPLVPFIVKIDHVQCFVRARGAVRVDGSWVATGRSLRRIRGASRGLVSNSGGYGGLYQRRENDYTLSHENRNAVPS